MSCLAKKSGVVNRKGYASIEYYDKDDKPVYYCYGYTDKMTDELIPICKECRKNVIYAQEDMEREYGKRD